MKKNSGINLPPPSPELARVAYSIPETAAKLGIGRTLAYRLIEEGQLRSVKLGKRHIVTAKELDDFLNRKQGGE